MKSIYLLLIVVVLGAQPLISDAQVYKWKDKDGSIRYTDTPPPSNIKQETIGSKKVLLVEVVNTSKTNAAISCATSVAIAAPNIPYIGIKNIFSATLIIAPAKVL